MHSVWKSQISKQIAFMVFFPRLLFTLCAQADTEAAVPRGADFMENATPSREGGCPGLNFPVRVPCSLSPLGQQGEVRRGGDHVLGASDVDGRLEPGDSQSLSFRASPSQCQTHTRGSHKKGTLPEAVWATPQPARSGWPGGHCRLRVISRGPPGTCAGPARLCGSLRSGGGCGRRWLGAGAGVGGRPVPGPAPVSPA